MSTGSYFALPARLYDDPDELTVWLRRALSAARGAQKPRKRRA